jgi:dihydrofolate reductase
MPIISLIAAMDLNNVIGNNKALPWRVPIPADWKNLFEVTAGKKMIMGRVSFDDENRVWSKEGNVVLSKNKSLALPEGFIRADSFSNALEIFKKEKEIFAIGGQKIFEEALPLATNLYLTIVKESFEGDTFFPKFNSKDFEIVSKKEIKKGPESPFDIEIIHYQRI